MKNFYKILIGIVAVIILVWIGIYIGKNQTNGSLPSSDVVQEKTEKENIKIGVLFPLTGDAALYGEAPKKIYDLAVEEINNSGGINGNKLELIYEDGKCNGKDATTAMQKLVSVDKVKIVMGGICSSETLAAVPIATQNQVMLFSPGSSSPDLTGSSAYFVRNMPSDSTQGKILADYAFNKKNIRSVAVIQEQQDYTLGIYQAFEKRFTELGGKIYYEKYVTSEIDFRTPLLKLKANKPDALFIISVTGGTAEKILKELPVLNWNIDLLVNDNVASEVEVVKRNPDILEGAISAVVGVDLDNYKFLELKKKYKEKYQSDLIFENFDPIFYDSIFLLRDALSEVGENPEKIIAWLKNVENWQGASGIIDIKDNGDRDSGHVLKEIKDGEVVPIR